MIRALILGSLLLCFVSPAAADEAPVASLPKENGKPAVETIFLPTGELFKPLIADLKEPRFYLSYRRYSYQAGDINAAAGGYGEIFGLYRHVDREQGTSWQTSFGGGIHSQFNLDAYSRQLVNTDYTIGIPFTYRKGADSLRLTLYHQSSHLGDEFLLQTKMNRIELSYEAVNFIASREWKRWRVYGGGEYLVHKVPSNLRPLGLQAGVEYYGRYAVWGRGRPVGGLDIKIDQEHDWALNTSLKAGFQFDSSEPSGRYIRVLAEVYEGFAPHGQFYTTRINFYGLGMALGFD